MSKIFNFINADIGIINHTILNGINWNLHKGQHTWISGANGSGKTTLCKCLAGQLRIIKGRAGPRGIGYEDIKMVSFTDEGKLFHSVNNVHYYQQRFNAWDADGYLTARDYLLAKGINANLSQDRLFLSQIGLTELLDHERIKLSSGQTRKLLLASALLRHPKLLILDNPYMGLDELSRSVLNEFLDRYVAEYNVTIILSGQADMLPDCVTNHIVLSNGTLSNSGPVQIKTKKILEENREIINLIGEKYSNLEHTNAPAQKIIEFDNVSISYKGCSVFEGINWEVKKGEKWAIFGPNGSGKSTLVSLIFADHPQMYSTDIKILGHKPGRGKSIWDFKKIIGFTSPEMHAYLRTDQSAAEVILSGNNEHLELCNRTPHVYKELCALLFKYYKIQKYIDTPYSKLSTGHQQLCLFIRALLKCPPLLLLDEPFQGLDIINISLSKNLIDQILLPQQSMIFITHYKSEIPSCVKYYFNLQN